MIFRLTGEKFHSKHLSSCCSNHLVHGTWVRPHVSGRLRGDPFGRTLLHHCHHGPLDILLETGEGNGHGITRISWGKVQLEQGAGFGSQCFVNTCVTFYIALITQTKIKIDMFHFDSLNGTLLHTVTQNIWCLISQPHEQVMGYLFNSLAPERFRWNLKLVIFKFISRIDILHISCEIAFSSLMISQYWFR